MRLTPCQDAVQPDNLQNYMDYIPVRVGRSSDSLEYDQLCNVKMEKLGIQCLLLNDWIVGSTGDGT